MTTSIPNTATIPFSGFYNSLHDSELDNTLSQMFADDNGDECQDLIERAMSSCNWQIVRRAYSAEYAKCFCAEFNIKGAFESLQSPREYNFSTDRIFITLAEGEAARLLAAVNKERFAAVCAETFTSRSGFISFYSANWETWGDVSAWDHNQLGALIAAFVPDDFNQYAEIDLTESARCNGRLDQWIHDATPNIERLYKIHDYLKSRADRAASYATQ